MNFKVPAQSRPQIDSPLGYARATNSYLLRYLILAALGVHLAIFLFVANRISSPYSGGGDATIYINLAQNISAGRGFTFAGTPTAFRAPLYPLILAKLMAVWPSEWRLLLRAIQLIITLCTAAACGVLAKKWGGHSHVAFLLALLMPTLLFFQSEILTESLAAMLIVLWWVCLCESFDRRGHLSTVLAGVFAGLASLERLNALPLVFLGAGFIYLVRRDQMRALLLLCSGCLIVAPWIGHNWHAFGRPLYSTHTGFALVEGVLSPTGRGDSGEIAAMRSKLGWYNADIESDAAPPKFRNELALDDQARGLSKDLWTRQPFTSLFRLAAIKLGSFWLSTDQIFDTGTFSRKVRVLRWGGVGAYWILIALAGIGWFSLVRVGSYTPWVLSAYAVLITILHLPLTMNTRLRSPLLDPLVAALAAVGVSAIKSGRVRDVFRFNLLARLNRVP